MKRFNLKKAVPLIGAALMAVSFIFITLHLMDSWQDIDFSALASPLLIMALIIVAAAEGFIMILNALNYRAILRCLTGVTVAKFHAIKVYVIANLYKYIPGGVMYVVGRNRLAVEVDELSHGKVALSTVVEGVIWAVVGVFIAFLYSFNHFIYYVRQSGLMTAIVIVIIIVLSLSAVALLLFQRRLAIFIKQKFNIQHLTFGAALKLFISMFLLMNLWASTFIVVLIFIGQPMTLGLSVTLMGLYILSWTVGFLTPGAPSGLLVREAVLMMFMSNTIADEVLITAIVIHRALQVLGDVLAYIYMFAYSKFRIIWQ